ncbi:MAG: hypothetical protein ACFFBD_23425 [Candidatus Hodarchaeota archaeon]
MDDTLTFDIFGHFIISRKTIEFINQQGFGDQADSILANVVPFGDPQPLSIKLSIFQNHYYICLTRFDRERDVGRGIIIDCTSISSDHTFQRERLFPELKNILSSDERFNDSSRKKSLTLTPAKLEKLPLNFDIPNLDGFLFAILTHMPIILVGTHQEILVLFQMFAEVLPPRAIQNLTYVTQSASLAENVKVVGLPPKNANLKVIQRKNNLTVTVVFISQKKVFAPFTSKLCQKLANALRQNKFNQASMLLIEFLELVEHHTEVNSEKDAMVMLNLNYSDAKLFLGIKNALAGNPMGFMSFF